MTEEDPDCAVVERYLGVFLAYALKSSPNSALAENARAAAIAMVKAVRSEERERCAKLMQTVDRDDC